MAAEYTPDGEQRQCGFAVRLATVCQRACKPGQQEQLQPFAGQKKRGCQTTRLGGKNGLGAG